MRIKLLIEGRETDSNSEPRNGCCYSVLWSLRSGWGEKSQHESSCEPSPVESGEVPLKLWALDCGEHLLSRHPTLLSLHLCELITSLARFPNPKRAGVFETSFIYIPLPNSVMCYSWFFWLVSMAKWLRMKFLEPHFLGLNSGLLQLDNYEGIISCLCISVSSSAKWLF